MERKPFSKEKPLALGPVGVKGRGIRGEAWTPARSSSGHDRTINAALRQLDGATVENTIELSRLEIDASGLQKTTRGSTTVEEAQLEIDLPDPGRNQRQLLLVEEGDSFAWVIPEEGRGPRRATIPLEAAPTSRGFGSFVGKQVIRVVKVAAGKAIEELSGTLVGAWDRRRHPERLGAWAPGSDDGDETGEWRSTETWGNQPGLLVLHGFMGGSGSTFASLPDHVVDSLQQSYDRRVAAYDHPTLVLDPRENARRLVAELAPGTQITVDILAHSRGGLVARELAALNSPALRVRSITFVGTPNDGTPLADLSRPLDWLDTITNLAGATGLAAGFEFALELATDVVLKNSLEALDGMSCMVPGSETLQRLDANLPTGVDLRSIATDFAPRLDSGFVSSRLDKIIDWYFGSERNDRVVPTMSTYFGKGAFEVPLQSRLILDSSRAIDHVTFWRHGIVQEQLADWLRPDWPENPPRPVPERDADPAAAARIPPPTGSAQKTIDRISSLGPAIIEQIEETLKGPISHKAVSPTGRRPAVVVVPGVMGSYLRRVGGPMVWIEPKRLMSGALAELDLSTAERPIADEDLQRIEPAGINQAYLPLVLRLAEKHDVYLADYDWRLDIEASAAPRLAKIVEQALGANGERPVHIVAHSMGGLVSRALPLVAPDVWTELVGRGGRLVQLGTPNRGSYSMVLTLAGAEGQIKALAAADLKQSRERVMQTVASFPGIYQLLPAPGSVDDDEFVDRLFDVASWAGHPVSASLLDGAAAFHRKMSKIHDPENLVYIAGHGHRTPFRVEIAEPDKKGEQSKFSLGVFHQGDGRVSHRLGLLDGVTTYYSTAGHGALIKAPAVLDALPGLLEKGTTDDPRLTTEPLGYRTAEAEKIVTRPVEEIDPDYHEAPLSRGERGRITPSSFEQRLNNALAPHLGDVGPETPRPSINLRVTHSSLEKADHAVAVGHYTGLPLAGAEGFLDWKLGGALERRRRTRNYPDVGGHGTFVEAPRGHQPKGALVLGLGQFGSLTQRVLTEAMTQAVSLAGIRLCESAGSDDAPTLGVSAVMVGSPGRHGVTIRESVTALVEGVGTAMLKLSEDLGLDITQADLEIIELYEFRADEALVEARTVADRLSPDIRSRIDVRVDTLVRPGAGGRSGTAGFGASGSPWIQYRAVLGSTLAEREGWSPDSWDGGTRRSTTAGKPAEVTRAEDLLIWSMDQGGSRVGELRHPVDLPKLSEYVTQAVRAPDQSSRIGRTLFELLFPHAAKFELDRSESMRLIVDEKLAEIPWELVADRSSEGEIRPLSIRAGMLRTVSLEGTPRPSLRTVGRNALVIGDPESDLPPLPGARAEAEMVAGLFAQKDFVVRSLISDGEGEKPTPENVLDALVAEPYRVVHIAAHGIFQDEHGRTGVVTGPEPHHRLTAADFSAMSTTPELVFLNCCHLGRLGSYFMKLDNAGDEKAARQARDELARPNHLAKSLSAELLKMGVRAVVVAGWAVDDTAARAFAERLYRGLLGGENYGESVKAARNQAFQLGHGSDNTWGAFQCYGSPDFQLPGGNDRLGSSLAPTSQSHLVRTLRIMERKAGDNADDAYVKRLQRELDDLMDNAESIQAIKNDGEVLLAEFATRFELGDLQGAVSAGEAARKSAGGSVTVQFLMQYANARTRLATSIVRAAVRAHALGDITAAQRDKQVRAAGEHYDRALSELENLNESFELTGERMALIGSIAKQRATMPTLDGASDAADADAALAASVAAYEEAQRIEPKNYHLSNAIQLRALDDLRNGRNRVRKTVSTALDALEAGTRPDPAAGDDFWSSAARGDYALTCLVLDQAPAPTIIDDVEDEIDTLSYTVQSYLRAFALRSTERERRSVRRHVRDLELLAAGHDSPTSMTLAKQLAKLGAELDARGRLGRPMWSAT